MERGGITSFYTIAVYTGYANDHGDAGRDEKMTGCEALFKVTN
jgi:hypothetical protein